MRLDDPVTAAHEWLTVGVILTVIVVAFLLTLTG